MKKLKIIYLGNFGNENSDKTEEHIKDAFEQLGHEVVAIKESSFTADDILAVKDPDLFLFHKGGLSVNFPLETLIKVLNYLTCKKVFWYFDKVFPDREEYIESIADYVDIGFLTDDTYLRRHKFKNLFCLRQGIGQEETSLGSLKKEYECDIAFTGNIYSEDRRQMEMLLKSIYGDKFKVFDNVFNRDLYDLCASAKIVLAPMYPNDEFYWSSRIYMVLGSGGFLIHPDLYGLKEEFEEGKHFAGYKTIKEMKDTIDFFLEHKPERKMIQQEGYQHCIENYTYQNRVEEMLKKIYETPTRK